MRIFVASWFFPPANSSEGMVSFKLLSHSEHQYDVCSSTSMQWGYDSQMELSADNITPYTVATDSIEEWVDFAVSLFEENHAINPYDAIMTRSMPPESVDVGTRIRESHPDIPWIASFGDPLVQTPAMEYAIKKSKSLTASQKSAFRQRMRAPRCCDDWIGAGDSTIDLFCRYKNYEMRAIREADLFIAPNGPQANLMLCGLSDEKAAVISHSFDPALYPAVAGEEHDYIELVFLGFSNHERSLVPFVKAMHVLQVNNPDALRKIKLRFIGNITDDSASVITNYYLDEYVSVEQSVDYIDSLGIMRSADWLIHVDAYYPLFKETGGSVYLAGKLADYIGSGKPILALTGKHSPADRLVKQYGGCSVHIGKDQVHELADVLEQIALGLVANDVNGAVSRMYSANAVAQSLDDAMREMLSRIEESAGPYEEPVIAEADFNDKILTICVPAYNVERYLERCLDSLIKCNRADALEVIVVNDGSHDKTQKIAHMYSRKYPTVVRVIDKENGGHGSTINAAMRRANGTYFRVLDGDDWLDADELGKFVSIIESLERPVDLISTDYCQINIDTGVVDHIRKKAAKIEYGVAYEISEIDISREYFSLGSTTYRLDVLRECGLELFEHCFYVDVQYQMIPLPFVKTVMFTKGNLYHYAVGRDEQSVSKTSFVSRYDNHTAVMKNVLEYYMAHRARLSNSVNQYYETLILNNFLKTQYTISLVFDGNRNQGFERAKAFDSYLRELNREWFDRAGELYPALAGLRKTHFDPDKTPRSFTLQSRFPSVPKKAVFKVTRRVLAGGIGDIVDKELDKRARAKARKSKRR